MDYSYSMKTPFTKGSSNVPGEPKKSSLGKESESYISGHSFTSDSLRKTHNENVIEQKSKQSLYKAPDNVLGRPRSVSIKERRRSIVSNCSSLQAKKINKSVVFSFNIGKKTILMDIGMPFSREKRALNRYENIVLDAKGTNIQQMSDAEKLASLSLELLTGDGKKLFIHYSKGKELLKIIERKDSLFGQKGSSVESQEAAIAFLDSVTRVSKTATDNEITLLQGVLSNLSKSEWFRSVQQNPDVEKAFSGAKGAAFKEKQEQLSPSKELLQKSKKLFEGIGNKFVLDSKGQIGLIEREYSIKGQPGSSSQSEKSSMAFLKSVVTEATRTSDIEDLKDLSDTLNTLSRNSWFNGAKNCHKSVAEAFSTAEKIVLEKQKKIVEEAISHVTSESGLEAIQSFAQTISKVRPDVLKDTYNFCVGSKFKDSLIREWKKEIIRRSFVEGGKSSCSGIGAMAHRGKGVFEWNEVLEVMESLDEATLKTVLKDFVNINKNNFNDRDRGRLQALSQKIGVPIDLSVVEKTLAPLNQGPSATSFQNNALVNNEQKYNENVKEAASRLFALSSSVYLGSDMSRLCAGKDVGSEFETIPDFSNQVSYSVLSSVFEGEVILSTIQKRAKFWGDVLNECVKKGDICSSMAIYAALEKPALHRLLFKKESARPDVEGPREGVSESTLNALKDFSKIASADGSYAKQRELYRNLDKAQSPCIPYFGLSLTDATFMADGNKDANQGNRIELQGKLVEEHRFRQEVLLKSTSEAQRTLAMQLVDKMNKDKLDEFEERLYDKSLGLCSRGPNFGQIP